MSEHTPATRGCRPWLALAVLVLPVFALAVDMTVLFLAMPAIGADLLPSGAQQLWVLHVGDLVGAGLVLSAGALVDRWGPRRLLVLALLGYALASALAAASTSAAMLIGARVLLGASGVAVTPAAMALARRIFPDDRRFAQAVAILMAAFSGGMALGPALGGVLLDTFWWGSVFLINVPIALLVLLGLRLVPSVPGTGTGRIDLPSVALSLLGIAGIVYGGQELLARTAPALPVGSLVLGIVGVWLFIRRQRRLTDPVLDLALFRSRPFVIAVLAVLLVIVADSGAELQIAQYLQVVTGLSPLDAGLLLVIPAVVSTIATAAAPTLLRLARPGTIMGAGGVLAALGAAGAFWAVASSAGPGPLLAAASVIALGIAPVFSLGPGIMFSHVPAERTGSAAAVQDVSGSLGNTAGLALGGSLAYLVYSGVLRADLPGGVDGAAASASVESIGGAIATAEDLGGGTGSELLATATAAFADATAAVYVLAGVGFLVLLLLVVLGLRGVTMSNGNDDDSGDAADGAAGVQDCGDSIPGERRS